MEPVRAACLQTLFTQIPNSFAAAAVVTIYMVATALPYSPHHAVFGWLAVQVGTQLARLVLLLAYRRTPQPPDGPALQRAAMLNTAYMLTAGLVWGSTAFLFIRPETPVSLAYTMCGLYGIAGGSVPGNAYNPPGLWLFISGIFGLVLIRLLQLGGYENTVLAIASFAYAGILSLFCQVQYRTLREGFAIRFENSRLLVALEAEKSESDTARARAEQANLAKSQLLAAASHDLRQPLHALALFSGSLQTLALDAPAREVAARIGANVTAMEQLFNGLLDISRLEANAVHPAPAPVCLQDLFDRLAGYFDPTAERLNLDLRFRETGHWVTADAALTEQICGNLISNALRYTLTGGVLVAARARASHIAIEVIDTGIGIADADHAKIFQDFVQLANPERDRGKGLGLGLAIAQRLAHLQGSRIGLRSVPSRGTRFWFSLPRCEATAHVTRPTAAPDLVTGLQVLVIDDDAAVRDATAQLFAAWGLQATITVDAEQGAAALRGAGPFDICLCDYRLPGPMNGLQVIAQLSQISLGGTKFCLLTGDVSADLLAQADRAGVPVMHKPLQPARLRALLNRLAVR